MNNPIYIIEIRLVIKTIQKRKPHTQKLLLISKFYQTHDEE